MAARAEARREEDAMTRAELFRWLQQRPGWSRAAEPARRAASALPVTPSRAARKAQYALEPSGSRPSRKSTRRSANRQKTDVQFRMKRRVSEARAPERAAASR
jgi:hypothetical protein